MSLNSEESKVFEPQANVQINSTKLEDFIDKDLNQILS